MALLKLCIPMVALVLVVLVLVSCHGASEGGRVELEYFEHHVRCDDDGCSSKHGNLWVERPPPVVGFTFLSLESAADLLIYAEFPVANGLGQLEIEVDEERETTVVYVERVDGNVVFSADRVAGVIEIPDVVLDDDCGCQTGRFELRFWDTGEDGIPNTEDDEVRQLGSGRFERGETFCLPSESFDLDLEHFDLDESLQVWRVDRCPRRGSTRPAASGGSSAPDPSRGDLGDLSRSDGGGCKSDDSSSWESDDSSSCESDDSSSWESDDSSSCDSDDSSSCDSDDEDTCAATGSARRPPRGGLRDGRLQLVLLLATIVWDLRRRARCVLA